MKLRFTYKEFTLIVGIVVAIIIMVTLWLNPFSLESGEVSVKETQHVIVPAAKIIAEKTFLHVTEILR